jgi:hypothetical protein
MWCTIRQRFWRKHVSFVVSASNELSCITWKARNNVRTLNFPQTRSDLQRRCVNRSPSRIDWSTVEATNVITCFIDRFQNQRSNAINQVLYGYMCGKKLFAKHFDAWMEEFTEPRRTAFQIINAAGYEDQLRRKNRVAAHWLLQAAQHLHKNRHRGQKSEEDRKLRLSLATVAAELGADVPPELLVGIQKDETEPTSQRQTVDAPNGAK